MKKKETVRRVALFIAKTQSEFVAYKRSNPHLSESSIGGWPVLLNTGIVPQTIVLLAEGNATLQYPGKADSGWKKTFWETVGGIASLVSEDESAPIDVFAHWRNLTVGCEDRKRCESFLRGKLPKRFSFALVGSTLPESVNTVGWGAADGPVLPTGTEYDAWRALMVQNGYMR